MPMVLYVNCLTKIIRGNKKKAEAFLMEQRQTFQLPAEETEAVEKGELFADYLER